MVIFKKAILNLSFVVFIIHSTSLFAQTITNNAHRLDSVLNRNFPNFSGAILYANKNTIQYFRSQGMADYEKKIPIDKTTKFIIGSVSKQITAVLVLQAVDRKKIDLNATIGKYLPSLTQTWKDSVKVIHLLAHTHGIYSLDEDLMFVPGTSYYYSQIGYQLLADILEATTHKTFAQLSATLFKKCKMKNTSHPDNLGNRPRAVGYNSNDSSMRTEDTNCLKNYYAASAFISTAEDLFKWNNCLHSGKILSKSSYNNMIAPQPNAIRDHPMFGSTKYALGTTFDSTARRIRIGQTGYDPGFASMSFYYPKTKSQFIVLQNYTLDYRSLLYTFEVHLVGLSQLEEEK